MTKGAKMLEKDIAKPTGGKMVPLYGGYESLTLSLRRHGPQRGHHHHLGHPQHGRQGGQLVAVTLIFIFATTNKYYMLYGRRKHDFCPSQSQCFSDTLDKSQRIENIL